MGKEEDVKTKKEAYVLVFGNRGKLPDPFGSNLEFPYACGVVLGVFSSLEELTEFFLALWGAAREFASGASLEEASERHGVPVEVAKRVATLGGFVQYMVGLGDEYSVMTFSGGECIRVEDIDSLILGADAPPFHHGVSA